MKISILGPTSFKNFAKCIDAIPDRIHSNAREVGRVIAKNKFELITMFNYQGMLKFVSESYKENGGKLTMRYTENDKDWDNCVYMNNLSEDNNNVKCDSWHDLLLKLVSDSEVVVCCGLSLGVYVELGYMKWNYQDKKGNVKHLIFIKEFLKDGVLPKEISLNMGDIVKIVSVNDLTTFLHSLSL
ncbi:hypothetical protein ACFLZN_02570 [Nanoarchaeota archaeon]